MIDCHVNYEQHCVIHIVRDGAVKPEGLKNKERGRVREREMEGGRERGREKERESESESERPSSVN